MKIIRRKDAIEKGLIRYYTGKPCSEGHLSERYTTTSQCIKCVVERNLATRKRIAEIRAELNEQK